MSNEAESSTAKIKVLTSNSMHAVMDGLTPQFERETGHEVLISYDPAKIMLKRILGGETPDLVILGAPVMDELIKRGKIAPSSRCNLAHCGLGMAVRAGMPKPKIDSVEAFKAALIDAASVAYTVDGASGIYFSDLINRLGIAQQVKAKARTRPSGLIGELLVSREAEIAVQQIPELIAVSGVELVGPFPKELQNITVVSAGILVDAEQPSAALALLKFLSTPAAARVLKSKGMEPN
jgi:molybdate transport system substrate-binding protein